MRPSFLHTPSVQRSFLGSLVRAGWLTLALAGLLPAASAQTTLYWDRNSTTAGASTVPTGTWNTTGATNWNTVAAGTGSTANWTSGSNAVFSAGTDATGAYTVTLGANMNVGNLSFQEGATTVTANTLNFTLAGGSSIRCEGVIFR